ncbi:MAG: hypothetical protein ACOCXG_04615 [Nanoarchaeota archaeon]
MRKLNFNYLKPQHYYSRIMTLYMFIALSFTIFLVGFSFSNLDVFLLKFIIILFELICLAVLIEFFSRGEYMNPLEYYDVEFFFDEFIGKVMKNSESAKNYISKYNSKALKTAKKIFLNSNQRFCLSSVKKKGKYYHIIFFNEKKLFYFYFLKFLVYKPLHKIVVLRTNGKFKIVSLT